MSFLHRPQMRKKIKTIVIVLLSIALLWFLYNTYNLKNIDNSVYYKGFMSIHIIMPGTCTGEDFSFSCNIRGNSFKKLNEVDFFSFEVLGRRFAKDKNNVYYRSIIIKEADLKTFKDFGKWYAIDKDNVYFDKNGNSYLVVKLADPDTFVFFEKTSPKTYAKDKNYVYYNGDILENADATTFEDLGNYYAIDKNNVYFENKIFELVADIETFEIINFNYTKDKYNVYYKESSSEPEILVEEDPSHYENDITEEFFRRGNGSGSITYRLINNNIEINKEDNNLNPNDMKLCINSKRIFGSNKECFKYIMEHINDNFTKQDIKISCIALDDLIIEKCISNGNDEECGIRKAIDPINMYGGKSNILLSETCLNELQYIK